MATAKLTIWLQRNDEPKSSIAQKTTTSRIGVTAVAMRRISVSFLSGRGAHLTQYLAAGTESHIIYACVSAGR